MMLSREESSYASRPYPAYRRRQASQAPSGSRVEGGTAPTRIHLVIRGCDLSYAEPTARRSTLGLLALAAAAISAVGIAIILIGIAFDIEGAQEGEQGPIIFPIAWFSYLLGGLAAIVLGAIAFVVGRRRNEKGTKRAGLIALAWAVIAVIIFIVSVAATS